MKKLIYLLFLYSFSTVSSQKISLVEDHFADKSKFIDLTTKLIWGSNTVPVSGWEINTITDKDGLSYQALNLTDSILLYANYHDTTIASTKASSCFDYVFNEVKRFSNDTIWVDFDVLWEKMTGETGRINVILMHEYPEGGPDFNDVDSLVKDNPFGRPAYHFRIRNSFTVVDKGYVGVGGGNDPLGRFYRHDEWSGPDSLHWLPGAVPASGEDPYTFPDLSLQKNFQTTMASSDYWRHVSFIICPDKLLLYTRKSADPGLGTLVCSYNTPLTNPGNYHSSYNYFQSVKAIRFYAYGREVDTYFANIEVKATENSVTNVNKNNINHFALFPNPSNGIVNIEGDSPDKIQVLNVSGTVIQETNSTKINLSDFPNGLYFAKIYSKEGVIIERIIKN